LLSIRSTSSAESEKIVNTVRELGIAESDDKREWRLHLQKLSKKIKQSLVSPALDADLKAMINDI
jgi:hypothetical protein